MSSITGWVRDSLIEAFHQALAILETLTLREVSSLEIRSDDGCEIVVSRPENSLTASIEGM